LYDRISSLSLCDIQVEIKLLNNMLYIPSTDMLIGLINRWETTQLYWTAVVHV